jgi:hypothetical protein
MGLSEARTSRAVFQALLNAWQDAPPSSVSEVVTPGYAGHMLHLIEGERSAAEYPGWIERYRSANPSTDFVIEDQFESGDRLCTRLRAERRDGEQVWAARGINISRFEGDRIAEEWAVWSDWRVS